MGAERIGLALLFEALVMALVKEMPVAPVAELIGETDMRVWRWCATTSMRRSEAQDLSSVAEMGMDDTSFRRGPGYVAVSPDLAPGERRAVLPGRATSTKQSAIRGFSVSVQSLRLSR